MMAAALPPGVWYAAEILLLGAVLALLILLGGCVTIVEQRAAPAAVDPTAQTARDREPVIFDQWGRQLVPLPPK